MKFSKIFFLYLYYIRRQKKERARIKLPRVCHKKAAELQTTLPRISAKGFDEKIKDENVTGGKKEKKEKKENEKSFAKRVNEKKKINK